MNYKLAIYLILISLSASIFAQKQEINPNGYNVFYYKNGQKSSEGTMLDGKPEGYWKTYYENGKLKSEGKRLNFQLDSIWVFYTEDGDTAKKINYLFDKKNGYYLTYEYSFEENKEKTGGLVSKELFVADVKQGVSYFFYPSGQLKITETYKNGILEGISREYSKDSLIITISEYHNDYRISKETINRKDSRGFKLGIWKYFSKDFKLLLEENYLNGKLNGYVREYDNSGKLIKQIKYENGIEIPETILTDTTKANVLNDFYIDGTIKKSGAYRGGLPVGIHKEFNEKGDIISSAEYDDYGNLIGNGIVDGTNLKQGYWKEFYSSGELKAEGEYLNNKRNKEWKFYFKSGKIEQSGIYKKGKPNGLWKWIYENGQTEREENFSNGKEDGQLLEYYDDGKIKTKGNYIDGAEEGEWFYHIGDHTEEGSYNAGLMEGTWKHYYENGKIRYEGNFIQGSQDGKHKYYWDNGKIKEEGIYIMGLKDGNWRKYDKDGNMNMIITFENGEEKRIDGIKVNLPE